MSYRLKTVDEFTNSGWNVSCEGEVDKFGHVFDADDPRTGMNFVQAMREAALKLRPTQIERIMELDELNGDGIEYNDWTWTPRMFVFVQEQELTQSYRFKTEDELLAFGYVRRGEDLVHPQGYGHSPSIIPKMFDLSRSLTAAQLESIMEHGRQSFYQIGWHRDMFIKADGVAAISLLCNCSWNKHPIWCKCGAV